MTAGLRNGQAPYVRDLRLGDCLEVLRTLEDASVDAVVTDPPYGINFMGKAWDGKAIEEAAARPVALAGVQRLTGSPDSLSRKLTARTGSGFANRAGEAGAYDFTLKGNAAFQAWCEACEWCHELSERDYEGICDCGLHDFGEHLLPCEKLSGERWVVRQ